MDLEKIKEALAQKLSTLGYELAKVEMLTRQKERILDVAVDASLDLDEISLISDELSKVLDEVDQSEESYLLDVHTVGLERELKSKEDIAKAQGRYIYVKTKDKHEFYADLEKVDDQKISIAYKDKTRLKRQEISFDDIKFIRLAIKF